MSEIRRYFANAASESDGWLYVEMSEDADGDYCRWDDVALLKAENQRMKKKLRFYYNEFSAWEVENLSGITESAIISFDIIMDELKEAEK